MPLLEAARARSPCPVGKDLPNQNKKMPRLTEARKEEMAAAIRAGRKPAQGASNRTILATGAGPNRRLNKYVVLADGAGKLTPAGVWYYENMGAQRPRAAFNQDQELISRGGNDYIRTRDRKEALVRSLRADGSTRVTQLGRSFSWPPKRDAMVKL